MNPYTKISDLIEQIVISDPMLAQAINTDEPAWIDVGAPLASSDALALSPCVRLDGLVQDQGKSISYTTNVHLWSDDLSVNFLDLADTFATALQHSGKLICESYLHRPDGGLNSVLIPVTVY